MENCPLTNDGIHGFVEWHDGLEKLALDPSVIRILTPMVLESNSKCSHPSIEITRVVVFLHLKLINLIKDHFKVRMLNA